MTPNTKAGEEMKHDLKDCPNRGVYPQGHISYSDECQDCNKVTK